MESPATTSDDCLRRRAARVAAALTFVAVALVGLSQIRFGEIYPPHGLGSGDSRFYAWMAIDFEDSVLAGRLDGYRVRRVLPSGLVHLSLRLLELPRSVEYDAVRPFQVLNLGLLLGTALLWQGIANATGLSTAGRWFGALLLFGNFACLKFFFFLPVLTDASALFLGALIVYGHVRSKPWVTWLALLAGAFTWPALFLPGCPLLLWPRAPLASGGAERYAGRIATGLCVLYVGAVAVALRFPVSWITNAASFGLAELNRSWLPVSLGLTLLLLWFGLCGLLNRAALFRSSTYLAPMAGRWLAVLGVTWVAVQCLVGWYSSAAPSPNPIDVFVRYLVLQPILRPAQAPVAHAVFMGLLPMFAILRWRSLCRAAHEIGLGMTLFLASLVLLALGSETRQLLHGLVALTLLTSLAVEELRFPRWAPWALAGLAGFGSKLWFEISHGGFTAKSPPGSYPAQYYYMNLGPWMADEMYALQGSIVLATLLVVVLVLRGSRALSPEEARLVWPSTRTVALIPSAALGLVGLAVVVEWPARLWLARAAARSRADLVSVPDPSIGWINAPDRSVRLRTREYDVGFAVNRSGLRGPDPRAPKPPGASRVLLIGGSLAEGYSVDERASLRAGLEAGLRAAGCGEAEVLNGAVARYATGQQAMRHASLAKALRPDVVVVAFNHEDLGEAIRSTAARGEDDEEDLDARAPHLPAWLRQPRMPLHRWRSSAALRILSNRTRSAPALHRGLAAIGLVEYDAPPVELWPFSLRDEAGGAWDTARETLGEMKEAVRASGGSMVVLDAPSIFEVDDRAWQRLRGEYRMSERFWQRGRVERRLRAMTERLGLSLVDPRPALARAQTSSAPAYWPEAQTWNAQGHALVASELTAPLAGILGCAGR